MGRLTRNPELKYTQSGTPVCSFSLAVDRGVAPKDGGERKTDFIDVVAWRNGAEFAAKYFVKGQLVAVVGRLQIRDWTDADGHKRRNAEVIAINLHFTGDNRSRASPGAERGEDDPGRGFSGGERDLHEVGSPGASPWSDYTDDDGELPF